MKIVFMGTPSFAVPALDALIKSDHEVLAVFCQPDRPKGRSKTPQPCPVKKRALESGLEVLQPLSIRKKEWRLRLEAYEADVFVVAAYGQILSQKIIDAPKIACVNLHASLLPRWRGASPIHMAVLHGDEKTGISLMQVVKELDAGPVYSSVATPIDQNESREDLENRLATLGAELLLKNIQNLANLVPVPQNEEDVTFAPIIKKSDGYLSFEATAEETFRQLNAFSDWPGLTCHFRGNPMKIRKVRVLDPKKETVPFSPQGKQPGSLVTKAKNRLFLILKSSSVLELLELQPSGKKAMPIQAFLNGYHPQENEFFDEMH